MKRSPSALWAVIDSAFADVVAVCRKARAAEALAEKRRREEDAAMSLGDRDDEEIVPVREERVHPRLANVEDLVLDLAFQKRYPHGADLVELKAEIRKRLQLLKNSLASTYSEEETHTILFPIVVYFDELARFVSRDVAIKWETFQGEIYGTESGGEDFFKYLEITKSPQLAIEVYYYCLADGFEGMYADAAARLDDYKRQLAERIQLAPVVVEPPRAEPAPPELVPFPYMYYVIAAAIIGGLYVGLRALGAAY